MELRQLRYFVTVADEGGFARAATRLGIVQAAVSQQVARLERELGVRLFDRSGRRARLTGAGELLLVEARTVLAAEAGFRQVAAGIAAGADGVLRLGTSQALGERLSTLLEKSAGVRVRLSALRIGERLEAVRAGSLDAAFVSALDAAPGLELLPLWTDRLVAALPASHALAGRPTLSIADLAGLRLILGAREENPPYHDLILSACRRAGFEPTLGGPFTNLQDALVEIGSEQDCWTPLYKAASEYLTVRRVAFRELSDVGVPMALAVPPGPPSPALRELLRALVAMD